MSFSTPRCRTERGGRNAFPRWLFRPAKKRPPRPKRSPLDTDGPPPGPHASDRAPFVATPRTLNRPLHDRSRALPKAPPEHRGNVRKANEPATPTAAPPHDTAGRRLRRPARGHADDSIGLVAPCRPRRSPARALPARQEKGAAVQTKAPRHRWPSPRSARLRSRILRCNGKNAPSPSCTIGVVRSPKPLRSTGATFAKRTSRQQPAQHQRRGQPLFAHTSRQPGTRDRRRPPLPPPEAAGRFGPCGGAGGGAS